MASWRPWTDAERDAAQAELTRGLSRVAKWLIGTAPDLGRDEVLQAIRIGEAAKHLGYSGGRANAMVRTLRMEQTDYVPDAKARNGRRATKGRSRLVFWNPTMSGAPWHLLEDERDAPAVLRHDPVRLWVAVRCLPPKQRSVIWKRYRLGLEWDTIGHEGTAYNLAQLGIATLRGLLTQDMGQRITATRRRFRRWDFRRDPRRAKGTATRTEYARFWAAVRKLSHGQRQAIWQACAYAPPEKVFEYLRESAPSLRRDATLRALNRALARSTVQ